MEAIEVLGIVIFSVILTLGIEHKFWPSIKEQISKYRKKKGI